MGWQEMLAGLINGILVLSIVQYLKASGMSWLRMNAPWALPAIALSAGALLTIASVFVSGFLGFPIDFSPIVAVLTGSLAVTVYDVSHGIDKVLGA